MNNKPRFYTKKNEPTAYALACGYNYIKNGYNLTKIHGLYKVDSLYELEYFNTKNEALKFMRGKK